LLLAIHWLAVRLAGGYPWQEGFTQAATILTRPAINRGAT